MLLFDSLSQIVWLCTYNLISDKIATNEWKTISEMVAFNPFFKNKHKKRRKSCKQREWRLCLLKDKNSNLPTFEHWNGNYTHL